MNRLALTLLLALFALPVAPRAALNLEGMTGYWMTPNAWTLKPDEVEVGLARHYISTQETYSKDLDYNWSVGMGVLPHVEVVARYAMSPYLHAHGIRDLSLNAKLGWTFFDSTDYPLGVAIGSQDVWGGSRYFHANYAVLTPRWKLLEASIGWGDGENHGPTGSMAGATRSLQRLKGVFGGASVDLPIPEGIPASAAVVYDRDADRDMLGLRGDAEWHATRLSLGLARNLGAGEWEYSVSMAHGLPAARTDLTALEPAWMRLRMGPWMQSFIGTEVGAVDVQVALETTPLLQPHEDVLAWARVRSLLYASRNFERGKAFARYKQDPPVWLEGAAIGWKPLTGQSYRSWLIGGMTDGSWQGGMLEASVDVWGPSLRMGAMTGYWYSTYWHQKREVWQPWLDWDSKDRNWFARLDAGRYWGQDDGVRFRLGRRYGRLAASVGLGRQDGINMLDGRFEFELDGVGWRPGKAFVLEPTPRLGHGFATQVAAENGDGNPLQPNLGKDPPGPVRGRYGTWP